MKPSKEILSEAFPFLTSADLDLLLEGSRQLTLGHKESISEEGDRITSLYYIAEGMIRGYFISETGEERTIIIRPTNTFSAPPGILGGATHSKYAFESIQQTELIEMSISRFMDLAKTNLGICRLYNELLSENLQTVFFRVELLAGMSPEERYEILMKERPELFQKSYHKYVANYLGITPNSLSRIIKRKKGT